MIPSLVRKAVEICSRKQFRLHRKYIAYWCSVKDLEQQAYLEVFRRGLWHSDDFSLLCLTAKSAHIDYFRENIKGFKRHNIDYSLISLDDCNKPGCDGGFDDLLDERISVTQMFPRLSKVQRFVFSNLVEGRTNTETGRLMGLTEARVSQIKTDAIKILSEIGVDKLK